MTLDLDLRLFFVGMFFMLFIAIYIIETILIIITNIKKRSLGKIKYIIRVSKKDIYCELIFAGLGLLLVIIKLLIINKKTSIVEIININQNTNAYNIYNLVVTLILVLITLIYTIILNLYKLIADIEIRKSGIVYLKDMYFWSNIISIDATLKNIKILLKRNYLKKKSISIKDGQKYLLNKLEKEMADDNTGNPFSVQNFI